MIYTSGSTGRPKGVPGDPRATWRGCSTPPTPGSASARDDVWTLFHSYAFDFSVWEIWGALLYGGRLVVVPYAVSRSPDAVPRPAAARAGHGAQPDALGVPPARSRPTRRGAPRRGAGAALRDLRRRGARSCERCAPGSSATATRSRGWSTCTASPRPRCTSPTGRSRRDDLEARRGSSIGAPDPRPRASTCSTRTLQPVADRRRRRDRTSAAPASRAATCDRPELTAERFVAGPLRRAAGRCALYRTGDLAPARCRRRHRVPRPHRPPGEDPRLPHRARRDRDRCCCAHPERARVRGRRPRRTRPAAKRLVAYVVPTAAAAADAPSCARLLRERPARVHGAGGLRRAGGAAADRERQARSPRAAGAAARSGPSWRTAVSRAARRRLETRVCAGVRRSARASTASGALDNFFELGGNSLLAVLRADRAARKARGSRAAGRRRLLPATRRRARWRRPLRRAAAEAGAAARRAAGAPRARAGAANPSRSSAWPAASPARADVEEFWDNLLRGPRDASRFFDDGELDPRVAAALRGDPALRAGARRARRRRAVRRRASSASRPQRSRADGSAAAPLPRALLGASSAAATCPTRYAGAGRRVRAACTTTPTSSSHVAARAPT